MSSKNKNNKNNNKSNNSSELYWFDDITVLLNLNKLGQISFDRKNTSYSEIINNVVRICILVGIVLCLIFETYLWLWFPILVMLLTYIMYTIRNNRRNNNSDNSDNSDNLDKMKSSNKLPPEVHDRFEKFIDVNKCVKPTLENPFMNALVFDSRTRKPACNIDTPEKARDIERYFNDGLYMSASDIFGKNNSQREFYVMPVTTFPNDQDGFARWLYGTPPTCKEGNGAQCVANIMDTFNRRMEAPGYGSTT